MPRPEPHPFCPVCKEDWPEKYYLNEDGEIIGCSYCVHQMDSYDFEVGLIEIAEEDYHESLRERGYHEFY